MKKIIVAFDGLKFSDDSLQYALMLAKSMPAHLVGISLESMLYNSLAPYEILHQYTGNDEADRVIQADTACRDAAIDYFESACRNEGVTCAVHRDQRFAMDDLLRESVYADLLVIDSRETMSVEKENAPTGFIRQLLTEVQCPVFLVNEQFVDVDKVIMLFDGSPSAVHAIKMFNYTVPALNLLPLEILTVNAAYAGNHTPDNQLMKEFMKRHHPNARYTVLQGHVEETILDYLKSQPLNALTVMGAQQHGGLYRLFHDSLSNTLIRQVKCPLFLSHY